MESPKDDPRTEHIQENGCDNAETGRENDLKVKMQNVNSNHSPVNGVSNHVNHDKENFKSPSSSSKHNSSSSEHKERSKDGKHHSSSSSSSKHKEGSSSSSKHRESSSSSKHREGSSSSSKHKDGSSSSSSSKHKEKSSSSSKHSSSSHSSSSSSKHKDGSSSSSSSKHREGGSSSNKESSKSKEGSSSSSHSKDKSSSSSKHSEKSKSSGSSSSDKTRDKSKDHHHSSSSKSSSSSSSDKHRSKDGSSSIKREKESSSGSSKTSQEDKTTKVEEKSPSIRVKEEPLSPTKTSAASPKKERAPSQSPVKEVKSPKKEVKTEVKEEPESDDDEKPLSMRMKESSPTKTVKREREESDEDDEPLSSRANKVKKVKTEEKPKPQKRKGRDDEDEILPAKKAKKGKKEEGKEGGRVKKEKEEPVVWKWWEEEKREDGVKWTYLEHKGPVFAPPYEPLPADIKFYYDGHAMKLEPETEEVATFYAKMLDHDYTTKEVFNQNFFKDWRKVMTKAEKEKITDLKRCNFTEMNEYFKVKNEQRKNMSKEEKLILKKKNEEITNEYGFCVIDGHKEKIGNFKIEPPGLFRGRGDHPKQGMLKRRVVPEDVIINCSKDSTVPKAPDGHRWKEVRHDNHVTWLSSWTENIQGSVKYVMLNAASKLKGEKDWQKYETARRLHKCVDKIRASYQDDWKSKEMRVRQRAVALYFIDKLALRAGNEKEEGETADTVGCCSLRVEHLTLHEEKDGKNYVVDFDFLGKDSIRYTNSIPVEKRVFKNLQIFMENKQKEDDIFDRLNTSLLNKHLQDLMEGLTAKVFRTYNASHTLQEQLNLLTNPDDNVNAKILSYNRANRAVAVLCNHQRAVPKTFAKSMENLQNKIAAKKKDIKQCKKDIKDIKADYKATKTAKARTMYEKKKKMLARLEEQLMKLEVQATDKDENKEIALGTSKLNYLDPRISIAWCRKFDVPIEKIYNKTQRDKFRWAIDMATADFQF
ncbi:DNA topoisomerase I, mitochondrial-like [Babylonia areolata]|uniref:DNA topoisomerase I, mitochondrial-like n=1 Tax=Babylonia areolata TaxID=304850 RepID=UPI003FD41F63